MRRRSPIHSALALLLACGLVGPAPIAAQSAQSPAGVVAALSLDPPDPKVSLDGPLPSATSTPPAVTARLRSGFVPEECQALEALDDPRLVDCWLEQFPQVAKAIRWEFVGTQGRQVRAWPAWDEDARAAVRSAFMHARQWRAGGMRTWAGPTASEPPINREAPHLNDQSITTVLDGGTAWILFSAHVGLSLAAEMERWVPWSIRTYDAAALEDLYCAPCHMFTYDREDGTAEDTAFPGYAVRGMVTPTHPTVSHRFLADHRLLADSPVATITAVLEWSRRHMRLSFNLDDSGTAPLVRPYNLAFWRYEGKAPLVSILGGTRLADPRWSQQSPQLEHWTRNCTMTTDAYVWLLRAANIPVRRTGSRATCNCSTPFFSAEGLYLSHGDDAYDPAVKTAPFSAEALLVRAPLWHALFPEGDGTPWCWNVGRRVIDLNVRYPSDHLVGEHCTDVLTATPRDQSRVLSFFRGLYEEKDLARDGLWTRLSERALVSKAPSCVRLRSGR